MRLVVQRKQNRVIVLLLRENRKHIALSEQFGKRRKKLFRKCGAE